MAVGIRDTLRPSQEIAGGSAETSASQEIDQADTIRLVYFSSATENTRRFVDRLGFPCERIPLRAADPELFVDYDYVLVVPTYGGGNLKGAVPRQVIRFLNVEKNRDHCKGVISAGNTNFGTAYCLAGDIVAQKVQIPHLYKFELLGTPEDVLRVKEGLRKFWSTI